MLYKGVTLAHKKVVVMLCPLCSHQLISFATGLFWGALICTDLSFAAVCVVKHCLYLALSNGTE